MNLNKKQFIVTIILLVSLIALAFFLLRGKGYKQFLFSFFEQVKTNITLKIRDFEPDTALEKKLKNLPYPRIANIFLKTPITESEALELSKYDLLILAMQSQTVNSYEIELIKRKNPDIILLAYTDPIAFPEGRLDELEPSKSGLWHTLGKEITEENYLKTAKGEKIPLGDPALKTYLINLLSRNKSGELFAYYRAKFYAKEVATFKYWDGIFFDTTWPTISWIKPNQIDYDKDGVADPHEIVDDRWNRGLSLFFNHLRSLVPKDFLLVGNDQGKFFSWLNGRMFEDFPSDFNCFPDTKTCGWQGSMFEYMTRQKTAAPPQLNIINVSTRNSGFQNESEMMFGLASTLLGDGFFNYDFGSSHRSTIWYYAIYDKDLGKPISNAQYLNGQSWTEVNNFRNGVYKREFEKATVYVNSLKREGEIKYK